jgi:hypothetical protein
MARLSLRDDRPSRRLGWHDALKDDRLIGGWLDQVQTLGRQVFDPFR